MSGIHSTGIGGAGNIGHEPDATYVDGNVVHEGVVGESTRNEYSSGRGGAGNIVESQHPPAGSAPHKTHASEDIVPETATRTNQPARYHTGRGGDGNAVGGHHHQQHHEHHHDSDHKHESLVDKAKHLVGLDKHKHEEAQ